MADELNEITFCDECPYSGEPNGCNRKEGECRAHDYCFDLRDERDDLKSENAALRERLSKAVELPCKVGDIIYIITFGYNGKHVTPDNLADCWSYGMEEVEVTEDNLFIMCSHFKDGSAFTDRAAAQKRLAELGGEKG